MVFYSSIRGVNRSKTESDRPGPNIEKEGWLGPRIGPEKFGTGPEKPGLGPILGREKAEK